MKQSSLVTSTRNSPQRGSWNTKQRRAYHRILSGFARAEASRARVRVLTLTSQVSPCTPEVWASLNKHFGALVKRIRRRFGAFEYWRLRTSEGPGAGVLHVIYRGTYIPQSWLKNAWIELHGAEIVYIQAVKERLGRKRIAKYLITHYMISHDIAMFTRQSSSWWWCFRGFVTAWHVVVKRSETLKMALYRWGWLLSQTNAWEYYHDVYDEKKRGRLSPFKLV